jgi:hypothetical protein
VSGHNFFHAMKNFKVFKHPVLGYQAVKVGFSWPGFLFPAIWLLIKKLWWHALIVVSSIILLSFIEVFFDNAQTSVMVLLVEAGIYILVGVNGNEWQMVNLQANGCELIDTVQAETPREAIGKIAEE